MPTKLIVLHNPQHDLESLLWPVVWAITLQTLDAPWQELGSKIFTIILSQHRKLFFTSDMDTILRVHLEPPTQTFAFPVNQLRKAMNVHYKRREKNGELYQLGSFAEIRSIFVGFFKSLAKSRLEWASTPLNNEYPSEFFRKVNAGNQKDSTASSDLSLASKPSPSAGQSKTSDLSATTEPSATSVPSITASRTSVQSGHHKRQRPTNFCGELGTVNSDPNKDDERQNKEDDDRKRLKWDITVPPT